MRAAKCRDTDYIDFLIATPRAASCCEAARSGPAGPDPAARDAYTRPLRRLEPDPEALWREVAPLVEKSDGVLIVDDSTLDHPYAEKMAPVHRHWSGKHRKVVWGINPISLVRSDGNRTLPVDYRLYDAPVDGLTKNDHFAAMIAGGGGARLPPARRPLRQPVRQPGQPQAGPRPGLDVPHAAEVQPPRRRRPRRVSAGLRGADRRRRAGRPPGGGRPPPGVQGGPPRRGR